MVRIGAQTVTAAEPPETIEEAIALHLDALYATARLLTRGNRAAADDLVQETALSAVRSWGSLRAPAAAKAWLLRILYRAFSSSQRTLSRRPRVADVDLEQVLDQTADGFDSHAVVEAALSDEMARAFDALPPGFGEAVWLADVEQLTLAETAEVLGIPAGTAASRVYRARAKLREHLRRARDGSDRSAP